MTRPETGPMKFGDDWSGVFVRGDHAFKYSLLIANVLDGFDCDELTRIALEDLLSLFRMSDERSVENHESFVRLKAFEDCVETGDWRVHE